MKGILMRITCHGYSIPIYWRLRIVRNKIDTNFLFYCLYSNWFDLTKTKDIEII